MTASLLLDQPDLVAPERMRRLHFGRADSDRIAILNARGARYDGGGGEPDLSLKWIPEGEARYRSGGRTFALKGDLQLLLNRGQPYSLEMRKPSESFVVFFARNLADAAWSDHIGRMEAFPEVPSVAAVSSASLRSASHRLRAEARNAEPIAECLTEAALALLAEVAALAFVRRAMLSRVPSLKRSTREELLRKIARAEAYLIDSAQHSTLDGAAKAAALSPFHLIRVFRAVHGDTPLAWAAAKRLDTARVSLLLTSDPIEDIVRRTGYTSRTAFDRAFQRRFHDTPGRVRSRQ